jgi:hypothetical protein
LIGPIVGAFLVNGAKSWLTVSAPEFWLYFLGALFIGVTLYLPKGVIGLLRSRQGLFRKPQVWLKYFRHSREGGNPDTGSPVKPGTTSDGLPGITASQSSTERQGGAT